VPAGPVVAHAPRPARTAARRSCGRRARGATSDGKRSGSPGLAPPSVPCRLAPVPRGYWSVGLAVCACSHFACTEFEDGDDTLLPPDTDAQQLDPLFLNPPGGAASSLPPVTGDWGCLVEGTVNEAPFSDDSRRFVYTVRIETLLGDVPTNTVVRACTTADLECAQPVTADLSIDARGVVEVPLFWGFDGYLEIQADGVIPSAYYIRQPLYADSIQEIPMQVAPLEALAAYAAANGATLREDRALLAVEVFDCSWALASGIQVGNDAGGVPFSFANGLPTIGAAVTDGRGLAGALNVPPGLVRAWGDIATTGERVGARTINARAGWLSGFSLVPAPLLRAPE